ncbi:MAG: NUDIX domain-containing protein [Actinomycetota bacterium]
MVADHLVLIRHAWPIVDLDVPSNEWTLSEEGFQEAHRLGLFLQVDCGSKIWSSDEVKAQQTASQIAKVVGTDVGIDARLAEVSRPTAGDDAAYRTNALDYLRGMQLKDWEPRSKALGRFSEAIDELLNAHDGEHLIVIDHGLIMTLYIASTNATTPSREGPIDPIEFWSNLQFPDAWRIDLKRICLDRIGFTWDGLPISVDPPRGAAVLVYRRVEDRIEFLLLHRSGNPQNGDWAWTPPGGARFPHEEILTCAVRELEEETGLGLAPIASGLGSLNWPQFLVEAPLGCDVRLSDEHDAYEWVEADEACERCLPAVVSDEMRRGLEFLRADV